MLCQNQNECYYGEYEYKWYNIHFVLIFLPTTYKDFLFAIKKKKKSEKKWKLMTLFIMGNIFLKTIGSE